MDADESPEIHSKVWLDHQVKGQRDEAGEVAEARRQQGATEGLAGQCSGQGRVEAGLEGVELEAGRPPASTLLGGC